MAMIKERYDNKIKCYQLSMQNMNDDSNDYWRHRLKQTMFQVEYKSDMLITDLMKVFQTSK